MSCGVGGRHSLGPALLWLWYRPVSTAPIDCTPSLGTSICHGCGPEKTKKRQKKTPKKQKTKTPRSHTIRLRTYRNKSEFRNLWSSHSSSPGWNFPEGSGQQKPPLVYVIFSKDDSPFLGKSFNLIAKISSKILKSPKTLRTVKCSVQFEPEFLTPYESE